MTRRARLAVLAVLAAPAFAAEPYADKVLEDGPQPKLVLESELGSSSGWPRGWRVEWTSARETGAQRASAQGLAFSGFLDTPDYGALSLSASLSSTSQGLDERRVASHLWRADQSALPLNGGWLANHSVGDLGSLQVPLARGFGRFGLPSSPMEGATAQYHRGQDTALNFSAGRPGLYSGQGVNSFTASRGSLAFAGAQHGWNAQHGVTSLALQLAHASDAASEGSQGAWAAWRWQGKAPWAAALAPGPTPAGLREGGLDLQANVMTSRSDPASPASTGKGWGGWVDARWRSGWLAHAGGVFHLEPGLRWGSYNAVSDLQGLYWRGDVLTRQWQISGSAEWSRSVSGATAASAFASLNGRYRVDTRNSVLAGYALRVQGGTAQSAQLGWEKQSDWGQSQVRADVLRALARRSMRMGVDHNFTLPHDSSLALSLTFERGSELGLQTRAVGWGVVGSLRPFAGVAVDASLRGVNAQGMRQLNGSVGASWAVNSSWSLRAQLTSSSGEEQQPLVLVSALTEAATQVLVPAAYSSRRVDLTLRYEERAGRPVAPIGGAPGSGAGAVTGVVYFDTNANGRREASEAGVPEVAIRLNGRFVTRTDAQGRYRFPAVAAGAHKLEIVTDNVPLPWSPEATAPLPIEVLVRATSVQDFPLRRDAP